MSDAITFTRPYGDEEAAEFVLRIARSFKDDFGMWDSVQHAATPDDLRAALQQNPEVARAVGYVRVPSVEELASMIRQSYYIWAASNVDLGDRIARDVLRHLGVTQ